MTIWFGDPLEDPPEYATSTVPFNAQPSQMISGTWTITGTSSGNFVSPIVRCLVCDDESVDVLCDTCCEVIRHMRLNYLKSVFEGKVFDEDSGTDT
jgi:hypothetical protein